MLGEIVQKRNQNRHSQTGFCKNVNVFATVRIVGTKKIIKDVDSNDLIRIESFYTGVMVCLDSWVGLIIDVHSNLILRLPDNTRCIVYDPQPDGFDVFTEKNEPNTLYRYRYGYYRGQALWGPIDVLEKIATWFSPEPKKRVRSCKVKQTKNVRVIVEEVNTISVTVHWQYTAYSKNCSEIDPPPKIITGDNIQRLKRVCPIHPSTLEVGDKHMYIVKPFDKISSRKKWKDQQKHSAKRGGQHKKKGTTDNQTETYSDSKSSQPTVDFPEVNKKSSSWITEESAGSSQKANSKPKKLRTVPIRDLTPKVISTQAVNRRKLKSSAQKKKKPPLSISPGDKVVVETIWWTSTADVVWQDGTVEMGISTRELFPIDDYTDDHGTHSEFFPGDFIMDNIKDASMGVYGVVQNVNITERTAAVKWFKTYATAENPSPDLLMENEVSAYDLKRHPDFDYRRGTSVIRVGDFNGENETCTAGKVLENCPDGKVRIAWADGHVSLCWPQDLYKINRYEGFSDEELSVTGSDDDYWQTESEIPSKTARYAPNYSVKPKLVVNIEKAWRALSHLEAKFSHNCSLQTKEMMWNLFEFYKDCRYLDKLMGSLFFHESQFQEFVEMGREQNRTNNTLRMAQYVQRLFSHPESSADGNPSPTDQSLKERKRDSDGEFLVETLKSFESYTTSAMHDANPQTQPSPLPDNLCVRITSIIIGQLIKAQNELIRRFKEIGRPSMAEICRKWDDTTFFASSTQSPNYEQPVQHEVTSMDESEVDPTDVETESIATVDTIIKPNEKGVFMMVETTPNFHKFKATKFLPTIPSFSRRIRDELNVLKTSLPAGTWVTAFEDRMDLFSVMIRGPEKTPYEDCLFFFDFQLSPNYPKSPPKCHYISYGADRLNPNLYEEGLVCVSLLGTWSGKGTEKWTSESNLLQIIVSIQGLILVSEPYFNEPGYERHKGSHRGEEKSRMYNEVIILKLVQSMTKLIASPHPLFVKEIEHHFAERAEKMCKRMESWVDQSEKFNDFFPLPPLTAEAFEQLTNEIDDLATEQISLEFPLIPATKGFCIALRKSLNSFSLAVKERLRKSVTPVVDTPIDEDNPSSS